MKRLISLILVLFTILSFTACGTTPDSTLPEGTTELDTLPSDTTVEVTDSTEQDTLPSESTEATVESTAAGDEEEEEPATQPSAGTIISTTPGNEESEECTHSYKVTTTKASTCTTAGSKTYTCSKCKSAYTQALALADHKYKDATCTAPKTCSVCSKTTGNALGHNYGSDKLCTRCGEKRPTVTFTTTVRSSRNSSPIKGITVSVYTDNSGATPAGTAVTDSKGVALIELDESSSQYRVVLTNVPNNHEAKECYTFRSTTVNINLTPVPVLDPNDHSQAMYKVGDTMADFTLTDTDGTTHKLSELKNKKDLIILDFWYVTCAPCKAEFPYFNAALEQYGDDIVLLALTPYDSESSIRDLREEIEIDFPTIRDTLGLATGLSVDAYPTTVFIDSSGKILKIHRGQYSSQDAFFDDIERYL